MLPTITVIPLIRVILGFKLTFPSSSTALGSSRTNLAAPLDSERATLASSLAILKSLVAAVKHTGRSRRTQTNDGTPLSCTGDGYHAVTLLLVLFQMIGPKSVVVWVEFSLISPSAPSPSDGPTWFVLWCASQWITWLPFSWCKCSARNVRRTCHREPPLRTGAVGGADCTWSRSNPPKLIAGSWFSDVIIRKELKTQISVEYYDIQWLSCNDK